MRVLFLGNNWVGWQIVSHLRDHGAELVGAVLHPPRHRTFGERLLEAAELPPGRVFDGSALHRPQVRKAIAALRPEIGICAFFRYLLRPPVLDLLPGGCVNVHPALLPYNRGGYPNVWSIIDRTPAGATLHYIDEGVDTGPVIAQRRVEVGPTDTGATLYRRLERACVDVFRDTWPDLARGSIRAAPQDPSAGTSHRDRDVKEIDRIDLDATYRARDLIDLLRARTFPPHRGAYFVEGGRRIYLRLELEAEPAATPDRARPAAPRRRAVPTTVAE